MRLSAVSKAVLETAIEKLWEVEALIDSLPLDVQARLASLAMCPVSALIETLQDV